MKKIMMLVTLSAVLAGTAESVDKDKRSSGGFDKTTAGVTWAKKVKQGFSMQVWLSNQIAMGIEAWDPINVPIEDCGVGIGLDFPAGAGSCIEHLFGMGPMIGGIINGVRRVSQSYEEANAEHEFVPERKDTTRDKIWYTSKADNALVDYNFFPPRDLKAIVNRRGCDDDGDGLIDEDELDNFDNDGDWVPATDDIGIDGLPDSMETGCKGVWDPVKNHDPAYDNYEPALRDSCHPDDQGVMPLKRDKDHYTQKNGLPDHGEPHVDEDFGAVSDMDHYMYATDTAKSAPGAVGALHFPMGIKIFMKAYSWRGGPGSFGYGIIPIEYYFVNIGRYTIHDVYIGMNADMDVGPVNVPGYFQHDYACYMPDLRTAYIHNAQDRGSTPLGMTVLGTPRPLDQLQYVFQWYDGGALGAIDSLVYTWLDGTQFGGNLIKQCKPPETPADCRVFFSFGSFNGADGTGFKPGDTLKISMALVSGDGVEGTENSLRAAAERALRMYQNGFVPPTVPPSPALRVTEGFKKVTLQWFPHQSALGGAEGPYDVWDDSNKIAGATPDTGFRRINPPCTVGGGGCNGGHVCVNGYLPGGRIIEGFRLYRSEDPGNLTPAKSAFTLLKQFDLKDDAFEFNVGIESTFVDTNLSRGKRYWYAVTSFSIPNITVIATPADSSGLVFSYDTLYTAGAESDISENAHRVDLAFSTADNAGQVLVVPNPYRVDQDYTYESGGWEGRTSVWTENNRLVKFIHLPARCTIRVFTLVGDHVATIEHNDPVQGEEQWNLLSQSNRALASGVYIFTVEAYDPANTGDNSVIGKQVGKFVLIR